MNLKKVKTEDYVVEEHGPVYNFLYSYKTYFLTFTSVNLLFVIFNIPMMLVAFGYSLFFLPHLSDVFIPENFAEFMFDAGIVGNAQMNDVGSDAAYQLYYLIVLFCVMFLLGSCVLCIGPFQAGFSQIYRNIRRGNGVFLVGDFKEGMKENWKQSTAAMVVSMVVSAAALFAIGFYGRMQNTLGVAVATFFTVALFIFIVMQNMVYQMIVSNDLPLRKIYMNAFLFVLLKFGPCLGLVGIMVLLLLVVPFLLLVTTTFFAYAIVVFLYLILVFSFIQYMFAFATGEFIKQYIVPQVPETEEPVDDDFSSSEDSDSVEE